MQLSKSPEQLLHCLRQAIGVDSVDSSVFGAAMQRCGQGRWWDALQEVSALLKKSGLRFLALNRNIYLTALFKCVKGEKGFGAVAPRQQAVLYLARRAWAEVEPNDDEFATPGLNAALRVCAASGDAKGSKWAHELWAASAEKHKNSVSYSSFALVLEASCQTALVDELLNEGTRSGRWKPDVVVLGGLVNAAGERHDWRRAEFLWKKIAVELGVKPNLIAYVARSKVYLLCGLVDVASEVIYDMRRDGLALNPHAAQALIQALLVVYHSSLAGVSLRCLHSALQDGESVIQSEGSSDQKTFVQQAKRITNRIMSHPERVHLRDVLIEWKSRHSVMASWDSHLAGSGYVKRFRMGHSQVDWGNLAANDV